MFPIKDLTRSLRTPHVNRLILITNIVVFIVFWLSSVNILLDSELASNMDQNFVMIPNEIIHGQRLYTLLTSMFMHGGWAHLVGNMLYLFIFGDNVEGVFNHAGYIIFYIICGLAASFTYIMSVIFAPTLGNMVGSTVNSNLDVGVVGASGAISGVLGAYLVLYPKSKILTLVFYGWIIVVPIPAVIFLGFWFIMQWLYGIFDITGGVAYWAHVGGFVAGIILALIFGLKMKKAIEARRRL